MTAAYVGALGLSARSYAKVRGAHPKDVEKAEKAELEIEVVDDTPEVDRDREPMKDPPKEVTDDELAQYTDSVKNRIRHISKAYHEERRSKEAAARERDEAVTFAKQVFEENKRLKGSLTQGQSALLDQAKKVATAVLESAEREYKAAYEAGDADALLKAQRELVAAQIRMDKVISFKPTPLQTEKDEVQPAPETEQRPQAPQLSAKTKQWMTDNPWFQKDPEMTALAYVAHNALRAAGVTVESDEYFEGITARVKKRFPEAFEPEEKPKPTKKPDVVAPATRSTAPKKFTTTWT